MRRVVLTAIAAAFLSVGSAFAETVVSPGGKPGVAVSWAKKGDAISLTLKEGFSPDDVADAILRAVPGAVTKVRGSSVLVSGVPEATLLVALERVQVDRGLDDIDNALASLSGSSDDEGSGSSIRAAKAAQVPEGGTDAIAIVAKIVAVRHKTYPKVVLDVEVLDAKGSKLSGQLAVVPEVKVANGKPDMSDPATRRNAAAWYSRPGDSVALTLVLAPNKKAYLAKDFLRQR
ncbi:MAG: hypothetical protein HYV07_06710 [Deltaproteobacteria bacterium]|nr:hypothetical protein [Deltaproteobacteria bacterium]